MSIELNLQYGSTAIGSTAFDAVQPQMWQQWFGLWASQLTPNLMPEGEYEVTVLLTDDREMQSLNAQYRHQDRTTDVLAFAALEAEVPLLDGEDLDYSEPTYLGDIAISVPTASAQALSAGHSEQRELAWLAAHGLLHLLGWDHPDERSLEKMLAQQEIMLQILGID